MNLDLYNIIYFKNYNCLKKFQNKIYSFQEVIEHIDINNKELIIEVFFKSWFSKVNTLFSQENFKSQFLNWYNKNGKFKILSILTELDLNKVDNKKIIKLFLHYDILMEQSIYEKDFDCLLNVLIDTIVSVYNKMDTWKYFKNKKIID